MMENGENGGSEKSEKLFYLLLHEEHGSKGIFIVILLFAQFLSSFYIVIDSVTRSSRDNYNFVLSCKLKFLTYHLRQQFSRDLSGNDGNAIGSMMIGIAIDQTIFRVPFLDMF